MKNSILDNKDKGNNLITLSELFSENHFYRIPDYQRGYSWDKEFKELWKDIISLYRIENDEKKHYTGMLALDEIKEERDKENENLLETESFYIVDGQQRITSLVITLKSIINYTEENDIEGIDLKALKLILENDTGIERFGYSTKKKEEQEYFEKRIYQNDKNIVHNNQYLTNINNAAEYIENELDHLDDEKIPIILDIILNRMVFNIYFITKEFDVRVTFETMNNRGKKLTYLELLKNRLMYLTTFFKKDINNYGNRLKDNINSKWEKIYENLNYNNTQATDDEYLKAHWIVYGRLDKTKGDIFIKDILEKEFAVDNGPFYNLCRSNQYAEAYNYLNSYINSLEKYSLYWAAVNLPEKISFRISNEELEWIKRISRFPGNLLFVKTALMVVLAEDSIDAKEKIRFYQKLEQFIFINRIIAQDKNDMSFLVTSAKELLKAEGNIEKRNKFSLMMDSIDKHDLNICHERIEKALDAFEVYIKNRRSSYYDWNGLKYFLFEYNESLEIEKGKPIEWYKITTASIEHVLPRTPTTEYWKKAFSEYMNNEEEKNKIINSLGNLLLLSSGAENASLSNYSFPVKKDMTVDSEKFAYKYGSRSAQKIAEEKVWTAKEIYNRTKLLFRFMYENWFDQYIDSVDEWFKLIKDRDLFNFSYEELSERDYEKLATDLENIDVSEERKEVSIRTKERNRDNYLPRQLLEYFSNEEFYLKYNAKNIQYLPNRFTFSFTKSTDNEPSVFKCGVVLDAYKYQIYYIFKDRKLYVNRWDLDWANYKVITSMEELPEKLKTFLRLFRKYLKRARNINEPLKIFVENEENN